MQRYEITGMSCAACASHVEKAVAAVPGVASVAVSLLTNSMQVDYAPDADPDATARRILRGGAMALAEGATMPSTPAAIEVLREGGVLFAPAKAANAGGVAVSGLEMCQNSMRLAWTFDEVDQRLHQIMLDIFHNIYDASVEYGVPGNLLDGANIAGFRKVADAMLAQGVC